MTSSAEVAASQLGIALPNVKAGSLRMFGDWFGRPHDNIHRVTSVEARGDDLVVRFNEDEELIITEPRDWEFSDVEFCVGSARRVVWRWHSYGEPKLPANLYTIRHWIDTDGVLRADSDVDWYTAEFAPTFSTPAAELL